MPRNERITPQRSVRAAASRRERSPAARVVLAALAAALVLFAWGFLYWTVLVPMPRIFGEPADEEALSEALVTYLLETDTYFLPVWRSESQVMQSRFETGPVATIFFHREGVDVGSPLTYLLGYLQTAIACLLAAMLLYRCGSALPSFGGRVGVVFLAGLCGTVMTALGGPIWWHQPWRFHLIYLLYAAVAWLLAGFVLAALIKKGRLRF
ncbi:MAG: hypothetical protein ACRD2Z_16440 [Thermoanaerobaculia bacterium]